MAKNRFLSPPLPLSAAATTTLVAGYLICIIYYIGNMQIGFPLTWPHWQGSAEGIYAFIAIGKVLKLLTPMLALLMLLQIVSELRRPANERRIRKSRLACDVMAFLVACMMIVMPWQVEKFTDHIPPAETVHNFEYNFSDQKWHYVPPKK